MVFSNVSHIPFVIVVCLSNTAFGWCPGYYYFNGCYYAIDILYFNARSLYSKNDKSSFLQTFTENKRNTVHRPVIASFVWDIFDIQYERTDNNC